MNAKTARPYLIKEDFKESSEENDLNYNSDLMEENPAEGNGLIVLNQSLNNEEGDQFEEGKSILKRVFSSGERLYTVQNMDSNLNSLKGDFSNMSESEQLRFLQNDYCVIKSPKNEMQEENGEYQEKQRAFEEFIDRIIFENQEELKNQQVSEYFKIF
mmetsp:Transcript_15109/g.14690  ORF Transcript_15109/g.14690 Transcript_15109/m.14690 type:complete len:158 (+) Transcript_15109:858-1331(+)